METERRGSDGRRIFNTVFKLEQMARVARGARTISELARELHLAKQRIQALERALGKQTMEIEMLQAARDEVNKSPRDDGVSTR